MHRIKKLTAIILSILTLSSVCVFGAAVSASASGTGAGLAEYALNAYYSGWSYVYGGSTPGAVDCSGLIYSYCGGERCGDPQLNTATETGSVSAGVPRVHGLGLWRPGHVGVYIADGMEVDARGDAYGVCYESISSYNNWTYWFKLAAVSYVTDGWEKFNGDYYYYENGQYIVDTSRVIDGTTYYFDSKGRSSQTPSDTSSTSSGSSSSGSSSGSSSSSKPTSWSNGSSGDEVKKIQNRLKELGFYTGAVDGNFGDGTEKAYKAFQEAAGLTVDGIAGSDRDVLYSDDAPYAKSEETTVAQETEETTETVEETDGIDEEKIASIQSKLKELGYYNGEETGKFDDATTEAIKAFQTANGLDATGVVDDETHYMLFYYDSAVACTESADATEATETTEEATEATIATVNPDALESGPVQLPEASNASGYIITNEQNQSYTDTASEVAEMTNTVTKRALSKSAAVIPSATTAEVKRTANIWLWFVLVAVILGALSVIFFIRDRKTNTRYARYAAKKKKRLEKASISSARW